jgi:undecaprenyl-diphosphatase
MLHAHSSSFPSGHAAYAGATAVALVLLFTRPGSSRLIWWLLAGLATAGMAWSRTYLQLHWLTDVLSGAALGIGVALVSFAVAQTHPAGSTPITT